MPTVTTNAATLLLARVTPALTIDAAVHLAVALGNEERHAWIGYYRRAVEPGGRFLLGQNSCYSSGRLLVRPHDAALFDPREAYRQIEVEWYPKWPLIKDCGHDKHGNLTRAKVIERFSEKLTAALRVK